MKKLLKGIVMFTSLFLFTYVVNAEQVYTFSCDYKFNSVEGKQIDVKVKVKQLSSDYLNGKPNNNYNTSVLTYAMNDSGKYQQISTTCQKGGYKNSPSTNNKLCILTEGAFKAGSDKEAFLKEAFSSGSPKCPQLYQRPDYEQGISLTVASKLDSSQRTQPISTVGLNCYKEDHNTAYRCNDVSLMERNSSSSIPTGNGGSDIDSNPAGTFETGEDATCESILEENLTKLVSLAISVLRIAGMIIAIVKASLAIVPAVHNPDKIGDAKKTCTRMGILLVVIGLFRPILVVIGNIFGFDLSCF